MHMETCICCIPQLLPLDLNGYSKHLLRCDVFMGKRKLSQREMQKRQIIVFRFRRFGLIISSRISKDSKYFM